MSITLGKNEKVIKSWDYATAAQGRENCDYNLTVTDKRLIHTTASRNGVKRKEIPVTAVVSIDSEYAKKRAWVLSVLVILLGVFGAAAGLLAPVERVTAVTVCIASLGVIAAGIAILIAGVRVRFSLVVSYATGITAEAAFSADTMRKSRRRRNSRKLRIAVDVSAAEEITDVIGALLLVDRGAE